MDAWGSLRSYGPDGISLGVWDDDALDPSLDPSRDASLDAWPDRGIGVWPWRPEREPLLPPLPSAAPQGASVGWILDWPVAWLGDAAFESWGHWGQRQRPRGKHQRAVGAHASGYEASLAYAPRRRGGRFLLLASLLLAAAFGLLAVSHNFPALAQEFGALGDGASSLGNGLSGELGGAPQGQGQGQGQGTATPATVPLVPPALGSDADAFAAFYGGRFLPGSPTAHYQPQLHDVSVSLDVTFGLGADRRDHVTSLTAGSATLAGWNTATADAICNTFLPPDAQLVGVRHVVADVEFRYTSASLAAAFSLAYFVDDNYNPVPAGTLTRLDAPPLGSATGAGSCTLSLGAH